MQPEPSVGAKRTRGASTAAGLVGSRSLRSLEGECGSLSQELQEMRAALFNEPPGDVRSRRFDVYRKLADENFAELFAAITRKEDDVRALRAEIRSMQPTCAQFVEATRDSLQLVCPDGQDHRRVGRRGFDLAVARAADSLLLHPPAMLQQTVALVLCSASGVGKTFATLSFRCGARSVGAAFEAVCAYVGFNQSWPLRTDEVRYLSCNTLNAELTARAVRQVVLQRLLLVLAGMCQLASLDELDSPTHSCQLMPQPCDYAFAPVADDGQLTVAIIDCLSRLRGMRSPATTPLVVLVAVDEAQHLDAVVPPGLDVGGARFALRALRHLQLAVVKSTKLRNQILVLPMATGIQAQTALSTLTEGANVGIGLEPGAACLTLADFTTLTKRIAPLLDDRVIRYLAAAHYPCVRTLLSCVNSKPTSWNDVRRTSDEVPLLANNRAFEVILAAFDDQPVTFPLPRCIPVKFAGTTVDDEAYPFMHFALWRCLHVAINEHRGTIDQAKLVNVPIDSVSCNTEALDCSSFESLAFHTWGYFMSVFCAPSAALPEKLSASLRRWLPKFRFQLVKSEVLPAPKYHTHPFESAGNLLPAMRGTMSRRVRTLLRELQPGQALWLRCGASAPFDFILIVRLADGSLTIRFADAKHHDVSDDVPLTADVKPRCRDQEPGPVAELVESARQVHEHFTSLIQTELGFSVNAFAAHHVMIVTNQSSRGQVIALSPSSFEWHPWSDFLFATDRAPSDL